MKARLYRGMLHYQGVTLHTASSGAVSGLDTLWLTLQDGECCAVGEVRLNITYLHGYSETKVMTNLISVLADWNWQDSPQQMLAKIHQPDCKLLAPCRMLLDLALHDLLAKQAGQSVADYLGNTPVTVSQIHTNQTLFWGDKSQLLSQAHSYVKRGFTELKLRTGVAGFEEDYHRLSLLRNTFGDQIQLAIDVNGHWSVAQAKRYLSQLQSLQLSYVEQPVAVEDNSALIELADLGIPIMLDESLQSEQAIDWLIESDAPLQAHLKLVKLGGMAPLLAAGRKLQAAGVPVMVGQMNEGHVATAAALQMCRVLQPQHAELYGADGLIDDPASGVCYQDGTVSITDEVSGLGVTFDHQQAAFLKEF